LRALKQRAGGGSARLFTALVAAGLLVATGMDPAAAHARPEDNSIEIVGGQQVEGGEFPWVVRLSTGCAGTLIQPRHVLTAAHCTAGGTRGTTSLVVTAGAENLSSPNAFEVRSRAVVRAPGFESVTRGNDWAVVKLARGVDLPVVELASATESGGVFTTVGWGAIREGTAVHQRRLRKAEVPFVPDGLCGELYGAAGYALIASDMMCAGDTVGGGRDACQGDSGGPLLRRTRDRWVQVGIVSWGVGCGRKAFPGVYTELSRFVEDIRAAIE
jgi:secreted trypsin-like serine protease